MAGYERSTSEEIANGLTHGLGALLGCVALALLVVFASLRGDVWHIVSCSIYGASLILLYGFSSAYHLIRQPRLKRLFQTLDHSAIYLLIAGTYTPFLLVTLRGAWGWSLFGVLWGLSAVGIILELTLSRRYRWLSLPIYLVMGWTALVALRPMMVGLTPSGMAWVFAGGLVYSLGVIFYVLKRVPFAHTIWHLFVLGGSVCHFVAVFWHVVLRA
ncbi:MAG: hemolysin III family protein [Lentisphaerae bacterium]|nr:hemolysin III family protein [Lentisphaerota bacterium]